MFLTTEPGTCGLDPYEFNEDDGGVRNWDIFRQAVEKLECSERFQNVVIDTADRAFDMCRDSICAETGHEYPPDDYGRTWGRIRQEFQRQVDKIAYTGRGVYLTSHVHEREIDTASGLKITRATPSYSNQARQVIEPMVAFIFYGEYMRDQKGRLRRVIVTQGDEHVTAGQRKRKGLPNLPRLIPLPDDEDRDYDVFARAFRGELKVDADEFKPTAATGKAAVAMLKSEKARRARGG